MGKADTWATPPLLKLAAASTPLYAALALNQEPALSGHVFRRQGADLILTDSGAGTLAVMEGKGEILPVETIVERFPKLVPFCRKFGLAQLEEVPQDAPRV